MGLKLYRTTRLLSVLLLLLSIATVQANIDCYPIIVGSTPADVLTDCKAEVIVTAEDGYILDLSESEETPITEFFAEATAAIQVPIKMEKNDKVEIVNFGNRIGIAVGNGVFHLINNFKLKSVTGKADLKIFGDVVIRGNRLLAAEAIEYIRNRTSTAKSSDIQNVNDCQHDGTPTFDFTGCESIYGNLVLTGYENTHNFYPKSITGCLKLTSVDGKTLDVTSFLKDLAEVRCKAPGTNEITDYCMPASTKKNLEALISGIKVTMGASCTTSMYNCIPEDVLELGETNCGTIKGNLDIGPSLNTSVLDLLAKVKMVKGRVTIDGVNDLNFFPELETVDHGSANEPAISIMNIKQAKEIKIFPKLGKVVSGAAKKMVFEGNNFTCTQNDIARMKQWSGGACGASASLAASPATGTTESSSEKKEGGSNTVIVVVCCVIGGVLILVGVVIALFIVMKKKKKAAEAKKAKEAKGGAKKSNMSTVEGGEKSKTGAAKGETPTPDAKGDKAKEPASGAKEPTSGAKDPASGAKDPAEGAKEPEGKDLPSASADPKSVGNGVEASN